MKLEVLTAEQVAAVDGAARGILGRTGVVVPHERVVGLLEQAGAEVERAAGRVRMPGEVVDAALARAGKTFTIYGRDRTKKAAFGVGARNYNSIAGEAHWLEADGRRRFATLADVAQAARLAEVLPGLTIAGAMADPHEIAVGHRCVEVAATLLRTTTKPVTFWFHDGASARFVVEAMGAVAGTTEALATYPYAYPFLEPISPLRFNPAGLDVLLETARVPLPVPIGPMAQVGLSAPGTLAGTVAQETAEILAGVVITQAIRGGTPVCFGGIPHAFDMRTTQLIFAGPEQALLAVAMTQMGKHYGLPVYINVGLTDAKAVDAQAGLEIGATLLAGALAGADIFGHLGISGVDQAASLEMLVFQHEAIAYVERVMRGIAVDAEHLAVELIDAVGPGGSFIDQEHTVAHFREEVWMPTLLDRQYFAPWQEGGSLTARERVRARLGELLGAYRAVPLDERAEKDLGKVVAEARRALGG